MYKIILHKRVVKQLKKLTKSDQNKVDNKLKELGKNPLSSSLDTKQYHESEKSWRLRIGNLRIIYRFTPKVKIIYVEHLGYRGDVYKH